MRTIQLALLITLSGTMLFPTNSDAQLSRKSVSAAEVTGTFRMNYRGRFKNNASQIKIASIGRGRLRVAMDLIYPYTLRNGELMVNMGTLDNDFTIAGDTAVYRNDDGDCRITIRFSRPGIVNVRQNGTDAECGFGHNVSSEGTYRKVSSRRPRFEGR